MRKVSSFLNLPVISSKDSMILGNITGVLCDNRLKFIEYFVFSNQNNGEISEYFIKPQSAKLKNNDSILLSKNLYIKNPLDIDKSLYIYLPLLKPVFSGDGKNIGTLIDVFFDETRKNTISISTTSGDFSISKIANVSENGIVLLKDGQKRLRTKKSNIFEKPEKDFKVELFEENNQTSSPSQYNSNPLRLISNSHFLIGRVVIKNIYSFSHELLIKKGTLISQDTILLAHKNNKLIELTLYSKV